MGNDLDKEIKPDEFGPNMWLVDEMFRRYQENPKAVSEAWQEFFADYKKDTPASPPVASDGPERGRAVQILEPEEDPTPVDTFGGLDGGEGRLPAGQQMASTFARGPDETEQIEGATALRGVAARIAENMEASLGIPTATSVRTIPAKLLEENRRIINRYLAGGRGGKVSFTHIIGYAIMKALESRPAMKASFAQINGKPHSIIHKHVNFGLAVDVARQDGTRSLLVPNIKNADEMDFARFFTAYEEVIYKVRSNKLAPDDFAETTVTLTNPGTVGTRLSVPRLMPKQGLIVGTGAIAYPTEYEGADPQTVAQLGVSKVMTITSTYDHRVIQGAESGEFLAQVHSLLLGHDRFYDEIFASLKVPYEPVRWSSDRAAADDEEAALEKQSRVIRLINMYRVRGHLLAELNPIGWEVLSHPELDLAHYGLTVWDLDREFLAEGLPGPRKQPLRRIIDTLRDAYSRTVGVEYMHISSPDEKAWIQQRVEGREDEDLTLEDKKHLLDRLSAAEGFERFLHTKYMGHKRFSLEGAESLIPMLDSLLECAADAGMIEVVMGMAHRGRLNVLVNIVGKPLREVFREFEGDIDPDTVQGSGDVKYHLGMTGRFTSRENNEIAVILASNPSHLEAVDPVVEGMVAAKQDLLGEGSRSKVMPLLLHGDAAFAGQGVVAETFNLSALRGYRNGGSVHVVVNNNIGFTTAPAAGRSTTYATDIAKMVQAPIFHVNGDDPEACMRVMRLAFEYRQQFHKDVVVDLMCYRRHGHNEADEPAFTQPLMYQKIEERRSVRKLYTEQLLNRGELTLEEAEASFEDFRERLNKAFEETRGSSPPPKSEDAPPAIVGVLPTIKTGVARDRLERVQRALITFPPDFEPHPKLRRMLERRGDLLERDAVDWAAAEAFAFGSLLLEGIAVRLSGQDSRRGTFSQRHSALVDHRTGEEYAPLDHIDPNQAPFRAYDSLLSELAVVGFEYGYSVANGDALVCWEAQFGDFINGAQVVVDQFVVAGKDKWGQDSGLVMLLPHGYEGQGPEHSSARLERFLTLAAENSIQVTQPTTPAQYFHLLRRQVKRSTRAPLIVLTPKWLLRLPAARSKTEAFTSGTFLETLDDSTIEDRTGIKEIFLCTGKVAYHLMEEREERKMNIPVIRLEQLYPFPDDQLVEIFSTYPDLEEIRWVQEEPENMGAWRFVFHQLWPRLPDEVKITPVARAESASPATGSAAMHEMEHGELMDRAFAHSVD